jgi:hypothetical protein
MVFKRVKVINLKLNLGKCYFEEKEINFLGHVINQQGSKPDPIKIHVSKFPIPLSITNVYSFLGLLGYYKSFIHGYAKIATHLFDLTKKKLAFHWTPQCQVTFDTL